MFTDDVIQLAFKLIEMYWCRKKKIKKNLIVKCLSSLDFHTSECTDMWIQFNDEKLKTT